MLRKRNFILTRAVQVLIVFLLSALFSSASFAGPMSSVPSQGGQYSCYSKM